VPQAVNSLLPAACSAVNPWRWLLCRSHARGDLIQTFGEAVEPRHQITQVLSDGGRRSVARKTPNPGRSAAEVVRRHAVECLSIHRMRLPRRSKV
jgi:hypothetical protein